MPSTPSSDPAQSKIQSRRREAEPHALRYASRRLPAVLGASPDRIALAPAFSGGNSLAYILKVDDLPRAVVFLIARYKNWCDFRDALLLGARHDLPLPRLLHAEGSPLNPLRGRFNLLTTDFAEGRHLHRMRLTPPIVDVMADTLARLHGVHADTWGKLRRPQSGSIRDDWRTTIAKRLAGLRSHAHAPERPLLDAIESWFTARIDALPEPRAFQLCHHHLAGDDMILSPDASRLTLIDCGDLQFSRAARDLACIRQAFFLSYPSGWPLFLDRYFSHFPPAVRPEWERELPLFEALYLLFKVRSGVGRGRMPVFMHRLIRVCGLPEADLAPDPSPRHPRNRTP